jgi:hypothetical protein
MINEVFDILNELIYDNSKNKKVNKKNLKYIKDMNFNYILIKVCENFELT